MSILKKLINQLELRKDPISYWRKRGMKIGEGCEIYSSANFGSEPYLITVGDNVRITHGVRLITHDGGVWVIRNMKEEYKNIDLFNEIYIGNNVHIGINATIMPGVKIGNNCIIGCGAIVTKDIPDNSVAVGVPARVIESVEEYLKKHHADFVNTKQLSAEAKKNYLLK